MSLPEDSWGYGAPHDKLIKHLKGNLKVLLWPSGYRLTVDFIGPDGKSTRLLALKDDAAVEEALRSYVGRGDNWSIGE